MIHSKRFTLSDRKLIELHTRWENEAYIPLHILDLVRLLCKQVEERGQAVEPFRMFCRLILSLIHQQYRRKHQHLTHLYSAFDPDHDSRADSDSPTGPIGTANSHDRNWRDVVSEASRASDETCPSNADGAAAILFQDLAGILERANYRRLSPRQIQLAVGTASHWGVKLRVRFSMFRRLEVYARGDVLRKRERRYWYRFFRKEWVDVPIYQRLVVLFRVKEEKSFEEPLDENCVHLRMFKNIPKFDVDMLLPGTGVRMTWIDRGKIGIPSLWGLSVLIWKILRNASLLALLGVVKIFASAVVMVALVIAVLAFFIKSLFSYSSTKRRYLLSVAQNLYYKNLDNNMGALLRLLDEAEQQEGCETLLAYCVLSDPKGPDVMTLSEIDGGCERLLQELTRMRIDFDINDAIRDLASLGIVHPHENGWRAMSVEQAVLHLDKTWDRYFLPDRTQGMREWKTNETDSSPYTEAWPWTPS